MLTPSIHIMNGVEMWPQTRGRHWWGLNTGAGASDPLGTELQRHLTSSSSHEQWRWPWGAWPMRRNVIQIPDVFKTQITKTNMEARSKCWRVEHKATRFWVNIPNIPILTSWRDHYWPHQRWCFHHEGVCGVWIYLDCLNYKNLRTRWEDTVYNPLRCDWQGESILFWRSRHHFLTILGTPHQDCSSPGLLSVSCI